MTSHQQIVEQTTNINLPGWKNITNTKQPIYIRGFWIAVILLSTVICVFQINERVNNFSTSTVDRALRVEFNSRLKFPDIVLCPTYIENEKLSKNMTQQLRDQFGYNSSEKPNICDFLQLDNVNISDLWEMTRIKRELGKSLITEIGDDFSVSTNVFEIDTFQSISGSCTRFKYIDSFSIKPSTKLYFILGLLRSHRYSLSFHYNSIINHYDLLDNYEMFYRIYYHVSLSVHKYHVLKTTENPCVSSEEFYSCRKKCLDEIIDTKLPCRLPFMENSTKPHCETVNQCKNARVIATEILGSIDWKTCSCIDKCQSIDYKFSVFGDSSHRYARIYFEFLDFPVQTVEEFQSYTITSLVCDIGGILSLYLGFCFLTLLEVLDTLIFTTKSNSNTKPLTKIVQKKIVDKKLNVWATKMYNFD